MNVTRNAGRSIARIFQKIRETNIPLPAVLAVATVVVIGGAIYYAVSSQEDANPNAEAINENVKETLECPIC